MTVGNDAVTCRPALRVLYAEGATPAESTSVPASVIGSLGKSSQTATRCSVATGLVFSEVMVVSLDRGVTVSSSSASTASMT